MTLSLSRFPLFAHIFGKRETKRLPNNNNMDNIIDLVASDSESDAPEAPLTLNLIIPGHPRPLPRPRFFRGGIYNPAGGATRTFQGQVRLLIQQQGQATITPFLQAHVPVQMKIRFFLKRPVSHFVGHTRGEGRLKTQALAMPFSPWGSDIDNMAKFVLDALHGIAYENDRQVVALELQKSRDNVGDCLGRIEIVVSEAGAVH